MHNIICRRNVSERQKYWAIRGKYFFGVNEESLRFIELPKVHISFGSYEE